MTLALQFPLEVEDDWPPVGSESLPFKESRNGLEATIPPLFVKDLSVGDVIQARVNEEGFVGSWRHLQRSKRSTIWLLRLAMNAELEPCLEMLRRLGCNTVSLEEFGCYSVDVPAEIPIKAIDAITAEMDPDLVAIAYPSLRHSD